MEGKKNKSNRTIAAVLIAVSVVFFATAAADGGRSSDALVDASLTIAYGLGLANPHVVFPARYFYIQAVDSSGRNFTVSPKGSVFSVTISGLSGHCRIWTQVLNRHDGSFIVRYRLMESCHGIRVEILADKKHVAQSPYIFPEWIYHEECDCPVRDVYVWQDRMQCATTYSRIETDLKPFTAIDMDEVLSEALKRFHHAGSHSICNYVVINNEVYRKCHGQHVGFNMFMDNILLSLARKMRLPDLDFIVNLGDWPLVKVSDVDGHGDALIPLLSWCGSNDSYDIVMPTYELTEATLETMGRVTLDMMSVQGNVGPPWNKKIEKGFWRGRDSRRERLQLVYVSKKRPELLNASLTNFFFFKDLQDEYGPKVKHISFFDFFEYKYQVTVDGTVAAYRLPYLLVGSGAVFKQDSKYYEHFYDELEPMVHYVPFQGVLDDLITKLQWAKDNDDEVFQISQNAQSFARENLMPKDIFCYHAALFENYAARLKSRVSVRSGMERVTQPSDNKSKCECQTDQQGIKDEL